MKLPSIRLGALILAAGSLVLIATGLLRRRSAAAKSTAAAEHVPTDLAADRDPGLGDRAIEAFRPDPTAAVSHAEREALRPPPPRESAAKVVADSERAQAF